MSAPYNIAIQFISLTVAWIHACIGLYFWLRMKSFFDWAAPYLLAVAILLPTLAMIGAHHAGREVAQLADDADWRKENLQSVTAPQARVIKSIVLVYFPLGYAAAIGLCFRRAWRALPGASAGVAWSRFRFPIGRCACRRA